ncbi:MAG TPA: MFS transporter [Sphingobium sp.]|uniref:MFS transporter n=1 Tax=Sphingobium sp. TaxID=1912891 RepID=UPI002ED17215
MSSFRTGWRQVGACVALLSATGMIAATYSVVAVPLAHEFQPSRMVLMLAMTIMAAVSALLSPLLGSLMDRSSVRRLMFFGTLLLSAAFVALSFATSFVQVLVIYGVLMAPANVLIGPMAASVLLSRWFVRRRGAAIGIAITGIAAGGFVFPPVIQGLLDIFPWREAYRVLALILFLLTVPAVALVVNRPSERGLHPDGLDHDPDAEARRARDSVSAQAFSARAILTDPTFWCAALVFAVVTSGMKGMVTNLMPLALDEGIQPNVAALLISIYAGCGFCAKFGFAMVADRLNMRTLMFVSLGGFAAGAACLIRADLGYGMIATGVGLIGLFGGLMVPMQGLFVPRIYGAAVAGRVGGMLTFVTLLALLSTPPLFGLIFDKTGSYAAIFMSFVVLCVVTMLAVPHIRVTRRPTEAERQETAAMAVDPSLAVAIDQPRG